MKTLIKNPRRRRIASVSLLVIGALLIMLAPEGILFGWIPMLFGIGLEIAGIALGHQEGPESN